jgi:purine-binding chemotaxis protein CheW
LAERTEIAGCKHLLICRVGKHLFAIDAAAIREVLPLLPLWRPPTLPPPFVGFVRSEGEVLPVLSPGVLFGEMPSPGRVDLFAHLVRPHGAGARTPCLLVDRCEDIVSAEDILLRPVRPDASYNGVVSAEAVLSSGVAHLLSLDRLLDESERARMAALTEEARRRAHEWAAD